MVRHPETPSSEGAKTLVSTRTPGSAAPGAAQAGPQRKSPPEKIRRAQNKGLAPQQLVQLRCGLHGRYRALIRRGAFTQGLNV